MTKKHNILLLTALALMGALVGARLQNQPVRYTVSRGFGNVVMKTLEAQHQSFHWEGKNLILETREPEKLLAALSVAADSLDNSLKVYYQNRACRDVTRAADGGPYRRLTPVFDNTGEFEGVSQDDGDFTWVYDPTHPDAVRSGSHRDYVAYPAVCALREQALIDQTDDEIRKLSVTMLKIDDRVQPPSSGVGMFASISTRDPYSGLNNACFMTGQLPAATGGHKCSPACLTAPFPVVKPN